MVDNEDIHKRSDNLGITKLIKWTFGSTVKLFLEIDNILTINNKKRKWPQIVLVYLAFLKIDEQIAIIVRGTML